MLHEVERLALGDAFGDVEQHDVAELFEANKMGERAANLAGTDQCNLGTRHCGEEPRMEGGGKPGETGHRPFPACRSSRPRSAPHVSIKPSVDPDATAWPCGKAR